MQVGEAGSAAVLVATFAMPPDSRYTRHNHDDHQLAWAADGVLTVVTDAGTWVLPSTRALWIPAGAEHETIADGRTTMTSLYLNPDRCAIGWTRPQPVAVDPLMAQLINYLAAVTLTSDGRARAEAVLFDLLEPVATATIDAPIPQDARARTLARAFRADTGLGFDRWRTLTRLQAALHELAAGTPVTNVARHVGYQTTSAFVAAFRRETGLTPGAYFYPPTQPLRPVSHEEG